MKAKTVPVGMEYLTGRRADNYFHDMEIACEYARWNRDIILDRIIEGLTAIGVAKTEAERQHTVHNYIQMLGFIKPGLGSDPDARGLLRKGAISAMPEERVLIPMNMRDGSLLCVGKGNPNWNCSAPHGAGRILSRSQAKQQVNLEDFKASMEGVFSTTVNEFTIDESPFAYKNAEEIEKHIGDTVTVYEHLRPIYNRKASS